MTAFDNTLNVRQVDTALIEDESGKKYEAHLILSTVALAQVGPQQFLPIPIGVYRVPFDKRTIKALSEELAKTAEQMDERPNIAIANDLSGVERAAAAQARMR